MPKLFLNLIQVLSLGTTTTTTTTFCTLLGKAHLVRETLQRHKNELLCPQCYSIAEILVAAAVVQEEDEILLLQCYNLVYVLAKLHMKNSTILNNTFGSFLYNPVLMSGISNIMQI